MALQMAEWQNRMEPYKVRVVETLRWTTAEERETALEQARYNLYALSSCDVLIDLLTDSGTCAVSSNQMAEMMRGDESYAGSQSFRRMEAVIQQIFGFEHILPTHQGRAAERLLLQTLAPTGSLLPSNTLFDTTRANALDLGMEAVDLPTPAFWDFASADPFKGNIDCTALEALLQSPAAVRVPFVLLTITNNVCADLPVSMRNLRETSQLAHQYGKPLYLDACRFAQNAWYIQRFEPGFDQRSIASIAAEIFSLSDGCYASAKKDAMGQIGGFLALRDAEAAHAARQRMLLAEGYLTYGGMTGRDMEAIATGLVEGMDQAHLNSRMETTHALHTQLLEGGVPLIAPSGGHAVYMLAQQVLPHLPASQNPGQALAVELYREGGIRSARICMQPQNGPYAGQRLEMLRLAIPNRVYSRRHLDYVAECVRNVCARASLIGGLHVVRQPQLLGGFMAEYETVPVTCREPAILAAC
ncbi:tryptophanase [Telmatobacter bradus]|uniref:tryptophanase n=1 Tax=Telmatobacter bradus TaxID=474953 RepID=UPI003B431C07